MTLDLEDRLRAALRDEAGRAPLDSPEWTSRRSRRPSAHPSLLVAASVAVVVVGGAGLATITADRSGNGRSEPFEPHGEEYPLEILDPATVDGMSQFFDDDLVRPGSVAVFTDGEVSVFAYRGFAAPDAGDRVTESTCVSELTFGFDWCAPKDAIPTFLPLGFGVEMRPAPTRFAWVNVPEGTAFVQLDLGTDGHWQRPVGHVAVLPFERDAEVPVGAEAAITAYADNGDVVAHFDGPTLQAMWESYSADLPHDNLSAGDNRRVHNAATDTMQRCVDDAGLSDPLAPAPRGAAQTWDRCLGEAQEAATATFEDLGGELVTNPQDDPNYVAPGTIPSS